MRKRLAKQGEPVPPIPPFRWTGCAALMIYGASERSTYSRLLLPQISVQLPLYVAGGTEKLNPKLMMKKSTWKKVLVVKNT